MNRTSIVAIARLDAAEVLRSRWLAFTVFVYTALAGVFVLVGLRESTVLGFTGTGRVLLSFCHALVVVLPLLALSATGQVINQARGSGALELLLSQPIRRSDYFVAVTLVRWCTLAVPLAALVLGVSLLGRLGFDQEIPWPFVLKAIASGVSLATAFVGIGLLISTLCANQAKAVMLVLFVWIAAVALVDFALVGLMLEWRLPPRAVFALAVMNPVESARLALLSSVDPELGVLGPVGFYLANRLGSAALFAVGIALPALFGVVTWTLALTGFRRGDVV